MPPTLANGKICYIEIPALDIHGKRQRCSRTGTSSTASA